MLDGVQEALVVCGHTHHQFDLRAGAQRVVNAGSVGMPYQGEAGGVLAAGRRRRARAPPDGVRRRRRRGPLRASGFPDVDDLMRESLLEPVDPAWIARFLEDRAAHLSPV